MDLNHRFQTFFFIQELRGGFWVVLAFVYERRPSGRWICDRLLEEWPLGEFVNFHRQHNGFDV